LGVSGVLADPVLELHDTNGNSITNDDWRSDQAPEISGSGLAPAKQSGAESSRFQARR
jgi:hypothetical protein